MKIAFFVDTFLPFITGVSVAVWDLARSLADRGHKIHVVAPIPRGYGYEHPNVHFVPVRSFSAGWIYPGLRFASPFNERVHRYMRDGGFDLIHYHTPLFLGRLAMGVARRLSLPLVGTYHTSVDSREYRAHWKMHHGLFDRGMKQYIDFFYRRCDLVSVPSSAYADEVEILGLKYPTRVISNGIDLKKFPEVDAREIRARYPGKIVLSVGRVAQEKNLMFLLEAWPHLQDEAHLIVIGGGPQESDLRAHAKTKGLKNVHFLGMIPHEDLILSGYHRAADVFVMTSMVETQGLALMEAQAAGLVSVGINAGGTKDLIVDGENGFLIEPGDQDGFVKVIRRLLQNDVLRDRMRDATLREIQRHDLRNVAKEWEEVYEELVARKDAGPRNT
jgi:glycosyltransferase involved in cell wall biosynthesis